MNSTVRAVVGFVAAGFWMAASLGSGATPNKDGVIRFGAPTAGVQAPAPAGRPVALTTKTRTRADFSSAVDWCWESKVQLDGSEYSVLDLPGLAAGGPIGSPRLPYHGKFIRVPDGAAVRLVVDAVTWSAIAGQYAVAPVQQSPTLAIDAPAPAFAKDAATYALDAWMPESPIRIADRMRIRGREFVYVVYTPVAYNPAASALRAASRVRWHIEFDMPPGGAPAPRADPVGQDAFAGIFERTLDATLPEDFAAPASPAAGITPEGPQTDADVDYLIITADQYAPQLAPLSRLKEQMGLTVRTVNLSTITTNGDANAITDFIRNAYETWSMPPTYLLLVGDAPDLPPHDETAHPTRAGMPATDLYYAAVDGDDIFPDLFCGRLACSTTNECAVIVNKIVNHQVSPDLDPAYRNSALSVGYFQDVAYGANGEIDDPADGVEAPVLFMESAEAIKGYLQTNGGAVFTSYTTETTNAPRFYCRKSLLHPNASAYMGTQEYLAAGPAASAVRNALDSGVSLAVYNSHGWWGGWDRFSVGDVPGMTNGTRLPVVLSFTCLSGMFDHADGACFSELLLSKAGGGAVAAVGATRNAMAYWTDWFEHGMFESFWPNYFETLSAMAGYKSDLSYGDNYVGRGPRLGQAVNFGRMMMFDKFARGDPERARYHSEIVTLFGDPHMHFQPWKEMGLRATYPASASAALAEFDVTVVNQVGAVVPSATVTITGAAGDSVTYLTDGNGIAHVSFQPLAVGLLTVEVTKFGMIPHTGTITLITQTMTVSHPASASAVAANFTVTVLGEGDTALTGAVVLASSTAGDHVERTTDVAGHATFAMAPLSFTTLEIAVTHCGYGTYHGQMQMIPGTLTVNHAAQVDELNAPVSIEVRDPGGPLPGASVTLTSAGGLNATRTTASDGMARFAIQPQANDPLHLAVTARGYTAGTADIPVVAGQFAWDAIPAMLDVGRPEPVVIRLKSGIDGTTVITGYTGSATIDAVSPSAPPEVAIIDVRRLGVQSYVVLECVKPSGMVDARGWQLVASDSATNINSASPDIRDPGTYIHALNDPYAFGPSMSSAAYWQAPTQWVAEQPGWVMLLDRQTNVVDLVIWGWDAETIATMAPVIGGRVVDMRQQWNGDGVPADLSKPRIVRIRSANPQDRNVADDFATQPNAASYYPIFTTPFLASGQCLEMTPAETGPFSNGVWQGNATVWELSSNVLFRAEDGPRAGDSEAFDLRQPPHVNYGFEAFNTQQFWSATFTVTVRALDKYTNTYPNFQGQTRLYGFVAAAAAPVLITECGVNASSANFIEYQNVSGAPASTHGWQLLLGDDDRNVSHYNSGVVSLPDSVPAAVVRTCVENRPPKLPGDPWIPSIAWSNGAPGWVMLLDDAYNIADFVAWGWPAADLTNMAVRVDGHTVRIGAAWIGDGRAYASSRGLGSLQRRGSTDYNRAADFAWGWISSRGVQNAGLTVPLTQARMPVPVVPSMTSNFADGVWTGAVAVQVDAGGMYLEVMDQAGRFGDSARFNVRYFGPVSVTVPRLVTEGDGVLIGQGAVNVPARLAASLTVDLGSSDTSEITAPATVTIPMNATSTTFNITVVDDAIVDFTQDAQIQASARGYSAGYGRIGVQDNELCTVTLAIPSNTVEGAGTLLNQGDIGLSANVGQNTTFTLSSSDTTEIQVPASVTVASGQHRARFDITVVDDAMADGEQTARITVTPDDMHFKTGTVAVADNDADHFAFRAIGNVQAACVPFRVTIQAADSAGETVNAYTGRVDLTAESGGASLALHPARTSSFVDGEWTGTVSVTELGSRVRLVARDAIAEGRSGIFDVTHGPLTHFEWSLFPTGIIHAGAWLPARLQACDTNGFPVASFRGPARIDVTQHDPAYPVRLLTFVRYAQMDGAYRLARAAIDTHFPLVVETLTMTTNDVDFARELDENDVFLLVPQDDAPAGRMAELGRQWRKALTGFVEGGGVVVACSGSRDEHVLLRQAGLADLLREGVGGEMSPCITLVTVATNRLTEGVAEQFGGQDVAGYSSADCEPIVRSATNRVPVVMHRVLGDGHVVMIGNGFSEPNSDFDRILANAVRMGLHRVPHAVSFAPAQARTFTDGVWTGIVQVCSEGLDTQVDADDQAGHRGGIGVFDVAPLRLCGFRFEPGIGPVFEWQSGGVTPYTIGHAAGGMDREFLPLETGLQATPPLNTYTGRLESTSPHFYRLSVPHP